MNIYSIRFEGEEYSEFEKFLRKFPEDSEYDEDVQRILVWIDKIIEKGALERYFKPEGPYGSNVNAIPIETNKLRLYCYRISDNILIIGNGDVKDSKRWQDSQTLSPHVTLLIDVSRYIVSRLRKGQIKIIDRKELIGNLQFKK